MRAATLAACLLLAGCAQTMYRWGGYDSALYEHYQNPQEREKFVASLAEVLANAEAGGARVPPGCYAEYGWALYEEGQGAKAAVYFEKEGAHWPESRFLMEKLIRNTRRTSAPPSTIGPAGAVEGVAK